MRMCKKCEHFIVHNDNASGDWIYENGGDTYGAISTKDFSKLSQLVKALLNDISQIKLTIIISDGRESYVEGQILYVV